MPDASTASKSTASVPDSTSASTITTSASCSACVSSTLTVTSAVDVPPGAHGGSSPPAGATRTPPPVVARQTRGMRSDPFETISVAAGGDAGAVTASMRSARGRARRSDRPMVASMVRDWSSWTCPSASHNCKRNPPTNCRHSPPCSTSADRHRARLIGEHEHLPEQVGGDHQLAARRPSVGDAQWPAAQEATGAAGGGATERGVPAVDVAGGARGGKGRLA
eukprot:scaffold5866_cov93-Isochrysis_galbana.AAC.5